MMSSEDDTKDITPTLNTLPYFQTNLQEALTHYNSLKKTITFYIIQNCAVYSIEDH